MRIKFILLIAVSTFFVSCKKEKSIEVKPEEYTAVMDHITEIMIHDIFSPPQASRIYAYPNIAAYEIVAQNSNKYKSLQGQLHGLEGIPVLDPKLGVNKKVAAMVAEMEVAKSLVFSEELMQKYSDSLYAKWSNENKSEFEVSKAYGLKVVEAIKKWIDKDNYKETRTMPKFSVYANQKGRWQPTPPAYMDAIEPHWNQIRTLVLDSASQFKPVPAFAFSLNKNSDFYKEVKEVYDISKETNKKGDKCYEVQIAQFWDCNPYVTVNQGHMMFAKKKITPGGHWMGIAKIASKVSKSDFDKTVYINTLTSIGLFDAFISCWDEKYRSNVIRPETVINQYIDEDWRPLLQTPPFPEYSSGHSVASASAAIMLTSILGDNFEYFDDTELPYGIPGRNFHSFNKAAQEAALSRFYGGIHYKAAIMNGINQGRNVGNFITNRLKMLK